MVPGPWEQRAPEREPSRERMSTWNQRDSGGEGPTRDRPTQRAPHTEGRPTQRGSDAHKGRDPHRRHTDTWCLSYFPGRCVTVCQLAATPPQCARQGANARRRSEKKTKKTETYSYGAFRTCLVGWPLHDIAITNIA